METNKHENKRRIKELERAAQAQSSTDSRPLKIIWTEFGKWDEEKEKAFTPGEWVIEWTNDGEIIKRKRGTYEQEKERWEKEMAEFESRRNQGGIK